MAAGLHLEREDTMRLDLRDTFKSASLSWFRVPDDIYAYVLDELRFLRDILKARPKYEAINALRIRFEQSGVDEVTVVYQIFVKSLKPEGDFELSTRTALLQGTIARV